MKGSCLGRVPWPKRQQISQCELFTAYTAAANEREAFEDADLIWYLDQVSAAMALIKSASAKADLSAITVAIYAVFARLRVRVWTESQGWTLKAVPCPAFFDMDPALVDSVDAVVSGALP